MMATDLTFDGKLSRAIYSKNVDAILRLCDDSSHRRSILDYKKDGKRLIHFAAKFGSVILLEKLRSFGADLTIRSDDSSRYDSIRNSTTLHIACKYSRIEVVKYLLQTVQDCSFKNATTQSEDDKNYRNAFYYAAQSGSTEVVKCLQLFGKLDINELLLHNMTTLMVVVSEEDSKSARILCECGANVNLGTFKRGLTPIQYIAERSNCAEIIKVLLNFGANVNELWIKYSRRSWLRQSPLFMALKHGHTDNAKVLIKGGADVSFVGQLSNIGIGPIGCFSLAAKRCPSLISEFIKHGADPNETHKGQSVLMVLEAVYANNDAVKALVEAGADVNQRKDGKTLIQRCTCYSQLRPFIEGGVSVKIIESEHKVYTISLALNEMYRSDTKTISDLLSKGADPNLKPEGRDPPLIVATEKNLQDDVDCLIKAGAQLDDVCRDGDTAIVMCCKKASHYGFQILNTLIESGASLNIPSKEGEYPLEILAQRIKNVSKSTENDEIENCVTKMIAKGANPNITRKGRNSPLITAVKKQAENLVQILLNAEADILHVGVDQRTALDICFCNDSKSIRDIIIKALVDHPKWYMASETEMPYLVDMLIENDVEDSIVEYAVSRGVDPNPSLLGKDSPLMKAITKQRYKISCVLIEAGADVTYANTDGTNAFDIFSESCKTLKDSQDEKRKSETEQDTDEQDWTEIMTKLFRCFMVSGIEVNNRTKYGIYPLQVSIWLKSVEMTKMVLQHDADVNIVDDLELAPLTIALENGHVDMVQLLLDAKAKINFINHIRSETDTKIHENTQIDCTDKNLVDPLFTRVITGSANTKAVLVKMLLQAGADPNSEVNGVDSPLLHAVRTRNMEIVRTLIEAGADVKHVGLNSYTALHIYFKDCGNGIDLYEIDRQMRGYSGPSKILQLLLSAGVPTNSMSVSNELPAHFALQLCSEMQGDNEEDTCLLIDNFKDFNILDNNGNTLLIIACAECSFNIINKIVSQGADVNFRGKNGLTALHAHMESKTFDNEVVSLLVKHGAEINKINDLGETALIRYIKRGKPKVLKKNILFLLEIGANPNTSVNGCNSALIEALALNQIAIFVCLLKAKSDVNHVGENSTTALQVILRKAKKTKTHSSKDKDLSDKKIYLAARNNIEKENKIRTRVKTVITLLLEDGANVNVLSKDGESPLYMLLKLHDTKLVYAVLPLFIKKEADPNAGLEVPLILAAQQNRQKTLKMLLEAGAVVDKMNPRNETALISSLRAFSKSLNEKHIETVKILLESGASVNLKDEYGNVPLLLPFMSGTHAVNIKPLLLFNYDVTIMKMLSTLLEKGACPNSQPVVEDSPLMLAVENCLPECVQILLKSGAHTDHIGKDGTTALFKCFSVKGGELIIDIPRTNRKRQRMIELLLANGARVNINEDGHDSPLLLAIQYGDITAIKALLKAGARLFHRGKHGLNAFERCLLPENRNGLHVFDILLQHQTPEKESIDSFFYLLWEYVKEKESLSKPLLENVCVKLLSIDTEITVDLGRPNEDSPLIYFCRFQCLEVVRRLLARKADVNHIGTRGKTVLHTLIDIKDKDAFDFQQMVEIIFSAKPNLDIKDECDKSPIEKYGYMYYGQNCHYLELMNIGLLVQHLLDAGSSLPSSELDKLLKTAAEIGDFKTMKSACRHGANINMTDKYDNSILHICWPTRTLDEALAFLEYYKEEGGFLNKINQDGDSPLLVFVKRHSRIIDKSEKKEFQIANIAAFFMKNTTAEILDKYGNSPLHVAVETGQVKLVEALLSSGAIASRQDKLGRTALHLCLENRNISNLQSNIVEIVSKLAESGNTSINLEVSGCTPLFLATYLYRYDFTCKNEMQKLQSRVVKILMEHGADPNSHNSKNIPLLSAVQEGDVDTGSVLLEKGALANVTNEKGQTALHILFSERSSISEDDEVVFFRLLINKDINVNATDDEGKSALFVAVEHYEYRKKYRKRISVCESNASFAKNVVNELIRHGADAKTADKRGQTVLNIFCQKGSTIEIGMILLQAGADPSVGNCLQSVLKNDKLRENVELFLELLKKGANPNMYSGGSSNLIEVTKEENTQLVEELLKYSADVNFVDSYGKSALHHACDIEAPSEKDDIIHLLITNEANLNLISIELKRPLDCLIYRMVDDIKELEIRHDEIHRNHYLEIDLSSFNQLIRCGSHLAPIENDDTENKFGEYCMSPDFSRTTSSFMLLIKNGLFTAAMSLVRCGWNIEKEKWIDSFDISKLDVSMVQLKFQNFKRKDVEKAKEDFSNFLETSKKSTEPLSILCRNSIRKQMVFSSGGSEIETKIQALQLPKTIRSFLNLTDSMPDEEIIMLDCTLPFDSAFYGYSDPTYLHADDDFYDEFVDNFLG